MRSGVAVAWREEEEDGGVHRSAGEAGERGSGGRCEGVSGAGELLGQPGA